MPYGPVGPQSVILTGALEATNRPHRLLLLPFPLFVLFVVLSVACAAQFTACLGMPLARLVCCVRVCG